MEEKILNEKESLELISQMILKTKQRVEKRSGLPFVLSGYAILAIVSITWILTKDSQESLWNLLLTLVPLIGFLFIPAANGLFSRISKSYIDNIVNNIWIVLCVGVILFFFDILISMVYYAFFSKAMFLFLIFIGLGIAITGIIIRSKLLTAIGITGMVLSPLILYFQLIGMKNYVFWFVFMMILLMLVVPGHFLTYKNRKHNV